MGRNGAIAKQEVKNPEFSSAKEHCGIVFSGSRGYVSMPWEKPLRQREGKNLRQTGSLQPCGAGRA